MGRYIRDIGTNLRIVRGRVDELVTRSGKAVADVANDNILSRELGSNVPGSVLSEGLAFLGS